MSRSEMQSLQLEGFLRRPQSRPVSLGLLKLSRKAINNRKISVHKIFTQVITLHTCLILCLYFLCQAHISYKLIQPQLYSLLLSPLPSQSPSTVSYLTSLHCHGQPSYVPQITKTHLSSQAVWSRQ